MSHTHDPYPTSPLSRTPSAASGASAASSSMFPRTNKRVHGVAARFKASLLGRDPDAVVTVEPAEHHQAAAEPPPDREGAPVADHDFAAPRTPQEGDSGMESAGEGPMGEEGEETGRERGRDRESRRMWRARSTESPRWKTERPWRRRVWMAHDKRGGTTEAGHAVKSSQALLYGSPAPTRRLSRTESGQEVEEKAWNDESLLRMTDWWRQVLVAGETPGQHELRMMNSFLGELLEEETPEMEVILRTRLHKLLEAIVDADVLVQREGPVEKWFHQLARKAQEVQRKWAEELDGRLEDREEERKMLCSEGGRLWGVHLVEDPGGIGLIWKADTTSSGGLADFEPGA